MHTAARLVERARSLCFTREVGILRIGVHENASPKTGHRRQVQQMKSVVRIEADVRHDPIVRAREQPLAGAIEIGVNVDPAEGVGAAEQLRAQMVVWLDEQHTDGHVLTVRAWSNQGAISDPHVHVSVKLLIVACNVQGSLGLG